MHVRLIMDMVNVDIYIIYMLKEYNYVGSSRINFIIVLCVQVLVLDILFYCDHSRSPRNDRVIHVTIHFMLWMLCNL